MNDLLKFWITKDVVRTNISEIKTFVDKIDTYTLYEYYANQITKEELDAAIENFKPWRKKKTKTPRQSEVVDVSDRVNPDTHHKRNWNSARSRCQYCRCIKKYCEKEECSAYKWDKKQ